MIDFGTLGFKSFKPFNRYAPFKPFNRYAPFKPFNRYAPFKPPPLFLPRVAGEDVTRGFERLERFERFQVTAAAADRRWQIF
jgi:hypothetical protein